jgi:hypothetical protein
MAKDLNEYIKNNRTFIKIKDGDTFRGVYKGVRFIPNRFDATKEVAQYMFQEEGSSHALGWEARSIAVAETMRKYKEGDELVIRRSGATMKDTKYVIEKLGGDTLALA